MRMALHSGPTGAGGELYEHHYERALEELKDLTKYLFPWQEQKTGPDVSSQLSRWERHFGIKMGSPEWNALTEKYDRMAELMERKRKGRH